MASIALRSSTRGRWHPNGCGLLGGKSGCTLAHNSSGIRQHWLAFERLIFPLLLFVVCVRDHVRIGVWNGEQNVAPEEFTRRDADEHLLFPLPIQWIGFQL